MSINEQMVQDIVQDVLAKMQIASDVQGDRGVFKDMNDTIEAAKASRRSWLRCHWITERKLSPTSVKDHGECRNPSPYGSSGDWHGKCRT